MTERKIITAEMYEYLTGCKPENDDLERVHCLKAGQPGHHSCGWNFKANLPMFMDNDTDCSPVVR